MVGLPGTRRGRGASADLEPDDGRVIEAKAYGRSARGPDHWLETKQVAEARYNPDGFHVCVVDNLRASDPTPHTPPHRPSRRQDFPASLPPRPPTALTHPP